MITTRRWLLTLLVLATGACDSSGTSVRLRVAYEADWNLDTLQVKAEDREEPVPVSAIVTLLVPDQWAGQAVEIRVDGMRGALSLASGTVEVTPQLDSEVTAEVALARPSCGDACNPGARECRADAVVTCQERSDGCTEWSDPESCPEELPCCAFGECSAECVDQCEAGDSMCSGSGTTTCDDADQDGCLEWGPEVSCPDGESCSGGACGCPESACTVAIVASGQSGVTNLALDATHVYWTNFDGDQVMRQAKAGGEVETIASGQDGAHGIAVDATHVYWTNVVGDQVMRRAVAGGEVETIASGQDGAHGIALDATHVYWTNREADTVARRALSGGSVEIMASGQSRPQGMAVDGTHIYWANGDADTVVRVAQTGGEPQTIETAQGGAESVALDDTHVYWTNSVDDQVVRRAKAGGDTEILASAEGGAQNIAVDATHVYWTNQTDDQVVRRAKFGGDTEILVSRQEGALGVAVDATHIYWTSNGAAYVARASRCACGL